MRLAMRWTSVALFALLGLFLVAFGVFYASVTELLFFHAAAVPERALSDVRPIYFALMKLVGGASAGLGLLGLYVTFGPLRQGARFAASALAVTYVIPVAMAAYVAETLAKITGAPTSWHIMGVLIGLTALALFAHIAARGLAQRSLGGVQQLA